LSALRFSQSCISSWVNAESRVAFQRVRVKQMIVADGSRTRPQAMLAKELKVIERFKAGARNDGSGMLSHDFVAVSAGEW
jgi:hypothetical protein